MDVYYKRIKSISDVQVSEMQRQIMNVLSGELKEKFVKLNDKEIYIRVLKDFFSEVASQALPLHFRRENGYRVFIWHTARGS